MECSTEKWKCPVCGKEFDRANCAGLESGTAFAGWCSTECMCKSLKHIRKMIKQTPRTELLKFIRGGEK